MNCSLTVSELKEKLKTKNLQSTGTKAELLKRLLNAGVTAEELAMTEVDTEPLPGSTNETQNQPDTRGLDEITIRELDVLRRERDVIARENELLRRELALLRETPSLETIPSGWTRVKKWQELKDIVGEFSGSSNDFDRWEKQVRGLLSTYELDNHQAKALVCSRLTGRALKWYHSRIDCVDLTAHELLRELKRLYGQRPDPLCLRRELEARKWGVEESFTDYVHDKTILANRVPVSETELLSYVVDGIPNRELQIQAKVQRYESVDEILTAFTNVQLPVGRLRLSEGVSLSRKVVSSDGSGRPPIRRPSPKEGLGSASTGRRCFNCNKPGHFSADCTRPVRERGDPVSRAERWVIERINATHRQRGTTSTTSRAGEKKAMIFDRFHGINGSDLNVLGKTQATIIYDTEKYCVMLRVVPDETMKNSLVLGRDFMKIANLSLSREETVERDDIADIMNIEVDQGNTCISADDMRFDENLSNEVKTRARELFSKMYINAQRPVEPSVENTMKLTLTSDKPFSFSPRRLSYDEKNKLRGILDGLLETGIIRESTSEYASPIVLTKKKNGEIRMCVDFRTLNKITIRDNFPLPLIEDQLDLLEGKKYFTTLDLKDGFFHVKMHEDSIKFTSFVTPFGQYEYTRMPFGLKGAPLKFQRYVTEIFKELINDGEISVYLDDFLIATETIEHHLEVLGKGFSILAKPLYDLTRKDAKFQFAEKEKQAFETLKNRLLSAPILSIYSPQDETELHCYASASGFGAILLQRKADKKLHPVFYFSKRTTEIESRYHSFELETLAIASALRRFRTYLLGRKFKIVTDCQALSLTLNKKETNPRIARWVFEMQNYDYELEHRAGSRMLHVDTLSRQVFVIEDNSFDRNLALCQNDDKVIGKIRTELENSENKLYEMRDGLVYRKHQDRILFYVPSTLESSIMYKYHNEMGHVGIEKTVRNITDSYWFPDMKSKIEKHIRGCLKCIAYTPNCGKLEGTLHCIPKGDKPFDTLHIDHLAPVSRAHKSGYKYIFVANGQVERYNRTILPMIAKLMSERGVVWYNVLREVEFACNNTVLSTKIIPRFKGPYEIDRVLRNDRYVIKDVEGFQLSQTPYRGTWEAANIRPWRP
ncbi:uncharacterized protein LOC143363456 [Halictus rubicundus]|uniref:uncharacterized protein LOC143363456 n=1 Tax=Halictus rubicundus TaxID=77578 RepID=UPI00403661F3